MICYQVAMWPWPRDFTVLSPFLYLWDEENDSSTFFILLWSWLNETAWWKLVTQCLAQGECLMFPVIITITDRILEKLVILLLLPVFMFFFIRYFPHFLISDLHICAHITVWWAAHYLWTNPGHSDQLFCFFLLLLSLFPAFSSHSFLLEPPLDKEQTISLICSPCTNEKTPIVIFDFMLHWLGLLINTMAS